MTNASAVHQCLIVCGVCLGVWAHSKRNRISLVNVLTALESNESAYTTYLVVSSYTTHTDFFSCHTLFQDCHEWPLQPERCASLFIGAGICIWLSLIPSYSLDQGHSFLQGTSCDVHTVYSLLLSFTDSCR